MKITKKLHNKMDVHNSFLIDFSGDTLSAVRDLTPPPKRGRTLCM